MLQASGEAPVLAAQQVVFSTCEDLTVGGADEEEMEATGTSPDPLSGGERRPERTFSALAIGDGCSIDVQARGASFLPTAGRWCRLHFLGGDRVLRVTDVTVQHGYPIYSRGHTYPDLSRVEFALGGDDAETGHHALYRFAGSRVEAAYVANCDALRLERAAAVAKRQKPAFRLQEPTSPGSRRPVDLRSDSERAKSAASAPPRR